MANRPIDKRADLPLRGHDHFWSTIRRLGKNSGTFTRADIDARGNANRSAVVDYVKRLARAGFIEVTGEITETGAQTYRLIRDSRETPRVRRDGSVIEDPPATDQMWRAMKMLRDFTYAELATAASSERATVAPDTAQRYLKHLFDAGYLGVVSGARSGRRGRQTRYRLKRSHNTGPRAPMIQRIHRVWDPNLGKVMEDGHER